MSRRRCLLTFTSRYSCRGSGPLKLTRVTQGGDDSKRDAATYSACSFLSTRGIGGSQGHEALFPRTEAQDAIAMGFEGKD